MMIEPHVEKIRYKLTVDKTITFDNPPAIEDENDFFSMKLFQGIATFTLKEHFNTIESARTRIDVYLRAWEIDVMLRNGKRIIWFTYQDSDVIDRNDLNSVIVQANCVGICMLAGSVSTHVTRHNYPEPPKNFTVTPDVESLIYRYEGYLNNREPLLSMAYFCLTVIEASVKGKRGKRKLASQYYKIEKKVLDDLGDLTSTRGDEKTARKIVLLLMEMDFSTA